MRNALSVLVALLVFAAILPAPSAVAQQQQNPGAQVGAPDGRGGRAAGPGRGRGRNAGPPAPAPRNKEGRALLAGATPADKGVWLPGPVIPDPLGPSKELPFQPWAGALFANRRTHQLEPHARCKPSGVARVFLTPYGVEITELPDLKRVYIFDIGGPHTFRTIYLDGRGHPKNVSPTYYGHSIGWWEGDTLVIDTVGFNESFWLDRGGLPSTERMRTVERLTRTNMTTLHYELTVDDPGAYTRPWTGQLNLFWEDNTELFEYVCQEQNYAHELMVGQGTKVDRRTLIVP
ncbi:MAG: hypothetical protein ACRD3G_16275 [Vicinamibacterales bacterium]